MKKMDGGTNDGGYIWVGSKSFLPILFFLLISIVAHGQSVCAANYSMVCDETIRTQEAIKATKKYLSEQECKLAALNKQKQEYISCMALEQNKVNLDRASQLIKSALLEVEALKNAPQNSPKICPSGNCD